MASIYKKQGGNVWYYNISFNGKRYRVSTKTTDKKTAQQIHTTCKNAGFKDIHIHDLRHVFASKMKMVMNGTSLYITGELLGHRTTQMTKRYSHLVPDTLRKAMNDVWGKKRKP